MRIIGVDPGLNCTGWAIIQIENKKIDYIDGGKINTSSKEPIEKRLYKLHKELLSTLKQHKPDSAAIEEIFVNKSPRSSLNLCHARGALLLTLSTSGIENIGHYQPNHIKKSITGNGHAQKHQMIKMVQFIIKTFEKINHNVADAISIAICHFYEKNNSESENYIDS